MTSHRGAWVLRTGVIAAMVAGTLAGVASPAFADHDVRLGSIGNIELRVGGGAQTVTLRVENRGQGNHVSEDGVARNVQLTMTVPGGLGVIVETAPGGCNLSANNTRLDCTVAEIPPGQTFTGVVQVGVQGNAPVPAGESRSEAAQVTLTSHGGSSQQFNVKVNGPDRAPSVAEVSGVVVDQNTGQPVEGARVLLVDSQGQSFERTTNAQGQFQFVGEQIVAGGIALRASKDGFESGGESTHNVGANETLRDVRLALIDNSTPSPSPTPSVTPTATPSPTASPLPAQVPASSGRSFFTTLMIILGVLFVALGIGAIVLLVIRQRRRRQEEEDDDGFDGVDDPTSGPNGPGPTPGSHGIYRPTPTQVAGAGAAHTQVLGPGGTALPAVGPRPALAEAPTMLQRGAVGPADQTAMLPRAGDPPGPRPPTPGAPSVRPASPQAGTYGAAATPAGPPAGPPPGPYEGHRGTGEYQTQRGGGYGGSPAGYGGSPAGYGGDRSYGAYDQPTGRHERPASGYQAPGYEAPGYEPDRSAGYRTDSAGYRNESYGPDPYTQPRPSSGGGYDSGTRQYPPASPEPPSAGGGYEGYQGGGGYNGGSHNGGYEGRGGHRGHGYEGGGYEAPAEYGRPAAPPPPAEDDRYYDDGTPRPRHDPPPGDRRRLDWLD